MDGVDIGGADLTPSGAVDLNPQISGVPEAPGVGQGIAGSVRTMLPRNAPQNPLDAAEANITAERDRAQRRASAPWYQFFMPDEAKKESQQATALDLQLQQIRQTKQTQATNQSLARNMGLTRAVGPNADPAAIQEEALREWRENGNFDAYRGLHGAGAGNRADLYMDEGVNALGKKAASASAAVDQLDSAPTQAAYNVIRNNILKNSKDEKHDYSTLGMNADNLPKTLSEWKAQRGSVTAKLNNAKALVEQFNQRQNQLSQAVPISDEKIAKSVTGQFAMSNGEEIPNIKAVSLPGAGNAQGGLGQPGSKDIANFGTGWNNATPENVKTVREQMGAEEIKGAISKYKMSKDFAGTANNDKMYQSAAGLALISDELGGIGRDVAEGSKAAGSIGLTRMLDAKYGSVDSFLNATTTNYAAFKAWVASGRKGEEPKLQPRLTAPSIQGIKDVANFKLAQTRAELGRAGQPVEAAGRYGIALDKTGLDEGAQAVVKDVYDEAVQKARLDMDRYPAIVKGDRRIYLPQDAKVPGMIPAGSYAATLTPTAPNASSRGAGASSPAGDASPTPAAGPRMPSGGGGGSGSPYRGVSQDYLVRTAQIESGNEPDPWKSGNSKTSASGAFQFTDSTWRQFKPDGAPDRAKDATPQQQTEAARKLTENNAGALAKAGVPVNDTTAYVAHNLGAAGAVKFITAPNDAKARDVVGETAARNNPLFFKGDPTVAEVKARYQAAMNPQRVGVKNGVPQTPEENARYREMLAKRADSATHSAAAIAPALGATAGLVAAGAPGALAGGAAGGAVRNYFNGAPDQQSVPGYAKAAGWGAAEALPAAIPGVGALSTAARVAAGAAVPAAEKLAAGSSTDEAIDAGIGGGAGALLGEGAGIFGHALWSKFGPGPQKSLIAAAKAVATEPPKIAGAAGKMVDNPAYVKGVQEIESIGKNPDQVAHDYRAMQKGTPQGEALAQRPGAVEAEKVGREYNAIRQEVTDANNPARNINIKNLQGGPTSLVRDATNPGGTVPAKYLKDAEDAQMRITAPAKDWTHKWDQLGNVRTDLLQKERDALASTATNKTERAEAMRALADSVRVQQEKVAMHVLGPQKGAAVIKRLETADVRYRNAMVASGDGDIVKAIAKGGPEGRKAQAAFDALAVNDPAAKRTVNSLVRFEKGSSWKEASLMLPLIAAETFTRGIPLVSGAIGAAKVGQLLHEWMVKRGAGATVTFKTMLAREVAREHARRTGAVLGASVGANAMQ